MTPSQQSAALVQAAPSAPQVVLLSGPQTGLPWRSGRQSLPQHSEATLHDSPSARQARGAQYAEMFIDAVLWPGSQ